MNDTADTPSPEQQLQAAWQALHDARARLFRQDVSAEERIALRAEIGRLSQEIRRLQWQEAQNVTKNDAARRTPLA